MWMCFLPVVIYLKTMYAYAHIKIIASSMIMIDVITNRCLMKVTQYLLYFVKYLNMRTRWKKTPIAHSSFVIKEF